MEEKTIEIQERLNMTKTKTNTRTSIKNLIYTLAHWILVVLLAVISFVLQYSFLVDTGETYSDIIFSGSFYRVNYVTFSIGAVLFLVGFYLIWKKCLVPDWLGFNGKFWMWKVTYVIIALAALGAILVAGVIVEFINTGLAGIIKPEWTTWGFVAFPLYIVFVAIIEVCGGIKKRKT